ncbi:urease accessory protein UreF [Schaalia cardiffensis F0333]|uniref:Urease accessory protein UreF n=1 Tax=Schaalia cardiffensis F0333 TaxID=888050 RepID=N6X9D4_9ACTO|nr:urease accessory protein UreF [Schaalia cardiffensis F0333]
MDERTLNAADSASSELSTGLAPDFSVRGQAPFLFRALPLLRTETHDRSFSDSS